MEPRSLFRFARLGFLLLLPIVPISGANRAWAQSDIPTIYAGLPGNIGSTVAVEGFYTNPADNDLVADYETFQDDNPMPPQTVVYLDGPAAPPDMWFGALVVVTGEVDTFRVDDPYWPADSVQVILRNITYGVMKRPGAWPELQEERRFYPEPMETFKLSQRWCDSCKFAIMISGGANSNHKRYWNNIEMLYRLKVDSLNYCPSNVYVLYHEGESEDTASISDGDVDSCTFAKVRAVHEEVAAKIAACKREGKKAHVQEMITNHGDSTGAATRVVNMLGSGTMSAAQYRALIQTLIDSCLSDLVIQMVQCYGGPIADSLKTLDDKEKTTMNVSSAAGDKKHRSDTSDPGGGWATYLKVKVESLRAGASYEDAVRAGMAAYDSLLHAQGLDGRRGQSVHWRSYPLKRYCEWHLVEIPLGGQIIIDFSGDSAGCGNASVYEEKPDGRKVRRRTWNWNLPGSAGYEAGAETRVVNDSLGSGRFWIHDDDGAYRIIVASVQNQDAAESPSNRALYAGFSEGGSDDDPGEFSYMTAPVLDVYDVDADGFDLADLPAEIGPFGVQQLRTSFTNYGNPYWFDMELVIDVSEVIQPGELEILAEADSFSTVLDIQQPGRYIAPLGAVVGNLLVFNPGPGGKREIQVYADFLVDSWGLRVAEGVPTSVTSGIFDSEETIIMSYPNPFPAGSAIRFTLRERGRVRLDIHNVSGRLVATLIDEVRDAGENTVEWNGRSATGGGLSSGAYFLRLVVGEKTATAKVIVLK